MNVGRIKAVDDLAAAPLAWFHVVCLDAANNIHAHAEAASDRSWLVGRPSLAEAVAYGDELHRGSSEGHYDWNGGSIESSQGA